MENDLKWSDMDFDKIVKSNYCTTSKNRNHHETDYKLIAESYANWSTYLDSLTNVQNDNEVV